MTSPDAARAALLRDRPFVLLLAARFLAMTGGVVAPVALAFGVLQDLHGSPTQLSVIMACETIPMVTFVLVGGVLADRLPRNRVVVAGLALSTAAFAGIGLMMGPLPAPWWALGVAAVLSGLGIAVMNPALAAIVPELVDADQLHAANGLVGVVRNTARIAGLLAAGFLVAGLGGASTLLLCAGAFALAGALFAFVPLRHRAVPGESAGFVADLRDGWGAFTEQTWLWLVVSQSSLHFAVHGAALGVVGPALAVADLGGARAWSWILAAESAGTLVGALAAMRFRPRRTIRAGVIAVAVTMPPPFLLLGLGASVWAVVAAIFATGVGMSLLAVVWSVTVQTRVAPAALSRVSSYDALGSMLMSPLGLLLAGPAVAAWGARRTMLVAGVALVVVTCVSLFSRDVRTVTAG